jgi:hypothetical protein
VPTVTADGHGHESPGDDSLGLNFAIMTMIAAPAGGPALGAKDSDSK